MEPQGSVALDRDDGVFRNRYAMQPVFSPVMDGPYVSTPVDFEAAARNFIGCWPAYHISFPTGAPNRLPPNPSVAPPLMVFPHFAFLRVA